MESSPAISPDGQTVYIGSRDGRLYALAAKTGRMRWRFMSGKAISSSPALSADGRNVFFGSWDHKVYAIEAVTGAERWSFTTGDLIYSSPAVDPSPPGTLRGVLYIGGNDGMVYAIGSP